MEETRLPQKHIPWPDRSCSRRSDTNIIISHNPLPSRAMDVGIQPLKLHLILQPKLLHNGTASTKTIPRNFGVLGAHPLLLNAERLPELKVSAFLADDTKRTLCQSLVSQHPLACLYALLTQRSTPSRHAMGPDCPARCPSILERLRRLLCR